MAKKKTAETGKYADGKKGKIQVRVSDFDHGLRVFDNVKLVRINSSGYTLLIMEDYFPCLGRVSGEIELVQEDNLTNLGSLKGFYVHRHNEFSLIIEDQLKPAAVQGGMEDEQ